MSAMSVAPRVSERVGDSGQGIPTLPPPVLPGSGSTGRGLFRSQPVPSHRLPGDGGDYRGAWAEGEGGSAGSACEPDARDHPRDAGGAPGIDGKAQRAEEAEMVDRGGADELADEGEEDWVAAPTARGDDGSRRTEEDASDIRD